MQKSDHCIIYTSTRPPDLLPGEEPHLGELGLRSPIRVSPVNIGDRLAETSRLNYGKLYTVEHNVKVSEFGSVHPDYLPILKDEWVNVFSRSILSELLSEPTKPISRSESTSEGHGGSSGSHTASKRLYGVVEDANENEDEEEGYEHL